jgi:hypothetical protein
MAKKEKEKFFNFFILNVKLKNRHTNKHLNEDDYIRLFKDLFKAKIHKASSNQKHCIIQNLFPQKDGGYIKYFQGVLAQFTFHENEKWFNLEQLDVDENFSIPDNYFPDAKRTHFLFIPKTHRFVYISNSEFSANPYTIKRYLNSALDEVIKNNELVDVDVESDASTLDKILKAPVIRKLTIEVNYSNPDNTSDIQKFFDEDIKDANVGRAKIEATRKDGSSIDLKSSKILYGAAQSSLSNGETLAKIEDNDGRVIDLNTQKFPLKEKVFGLPARMSELIYEKIANLFKR